jgi:hypothetical protein
MPKNQVSDTAAYTKAKPRVRAYMLDHWAAMHDRLVQQESDIQALPFWPPISRLESDAVAGPQCWSSCNFDGGRH